MTMKRKSDTSSLRPVFHPSYNGFSISNAITMPGEDGYAVYAEVLFDRVTIGEFLDKGDGGMYSFRANPQFSVSKIESVVRSFPGTNRDYGLGPMEVECDLCQVVDSLEGVYFQKYKFFEVLKVGPVPLIKGDGDSCAHFSENSASWVLYPGG